MQAWDNLRTTAEYLPTTVRSAVLRLDARLQESVQEIRLRSGRPVGICSSGREYCLHADGSLTAEPAGALTVSQEDVARAFQAVCAYSVHSHEQDVAEGFVTIRGGCRVGICGTAVRRGDAPMALRHISSLNFRIAGEYIGTALGFWQQIGQKPAGILVAGPVGSGKTTFLRDLCRLIGSSARTALIDERGELACMLRGMPQHDVGRMTDVLDGYPRAEGILTALRVLTPDCIICDEISTRQDADAVLQANGCGVQLAASCHAGNADELRKRTVLQPLLEANVFRYCVFLGSPGKVRAVQRLSRS